MIPRYLVFEEVPIEYIYYGEAGSVMEERILETVLTERRVPRVIRAASRLEPNFRRFPLLLRASFVSCHSDNTPLLDRIPRIFFVEC